MPTGKTEGGQDLPKTELESKWVLWAHLAHDTEWTLESYTAICTINNLDDCIAMSENLPAELATHCMLFIMREGISPTWEDDKNRDGGSFSYKMQNRLVANSWKELSYRLMGETLLADGSPGRINGITISPKKNFCIVKIWMSDCSLTDPSKLALASSEFDPKCCIFKRHKAGRS